MMEREIENLVESISIPPADTGSTRANTRWRHQRYVPLDPRGKAVWGKRVDTGERGEGVWAGDVTERLTWTLAIMQQLE
ncbi:hypothetical protein ElyMa_002294600 [Elysia marginata]|uniref:Uncharacterized protein n=1 Tax=Elysia marginata TaxID=1093978 RepID=A0AAV4G294_9GAST|nr:hypothetical protein ElyMa_002294600 [Elysia marginata]